MIDKDENFQSRFPQTYKNCLTREQAMDIKVNNDDTAAKCYVLDQLVRLPFPNKISEKYTIRSNRPDETCGNGVHHFHVEAINDVGEIDYTTIINFQHGQLPETGHNGLLATVGNQL